MRRLLFFLVLSLYSLPLIHAQLSDQDAKKAVDEAIEAAKKGNAVDEQKLKQALSNQKAVKEFEKALQEKDNLRLLTPSVLQSWLETKQITLSDPGMVSVEKMLLSGKMTLTTFSISLGGKTFKFETDVDAPQLRGSVFNSEGRLALASDLSIDPSLDGGSVRFNGNSMGVVGGIGIIGGKHQFKAPKNEIMSFVFDGKGGFGITNGNLVDQNDNTQETLSFASARLKDGVLVLGEGRVSYSIFEFQTNKEIEAFNAMLPDGLVVSDSITCKGCINLGLELRVDMTGINGKPMIAALSLKLLELHAKEAQVLTKDPTILTAYLIASNAKIELLTLGENGEPLLGSDGKTLFSSSITSDHNGKIGYGPVVPSVMKFSQISIISGNEWYTIGSDGKVSSGLIDPQGRFVEKIESSSLSSDQRKLILDLAKLPIEEGRSLREGDGRRDGSRSEDVKVLQRAFGLPETGLFEKALAQKVIALEKEENRKNPDFIVDEGIAGVQVRQALIKKVLSKVPEEIISIANLGREISLRQGDEGDDVMALQNALKKAGNPPADNRYDGDFGLNTKQAVIDFQKRNGLSPTGICEAACRSKLIEVMLEKSVPLRTERPRGIILDISIDAIPEQPIQEQPSKGVPPIRIIPIVPNPALPDQKPVSAEPIPPIKEPELPIADISQFSKIWQKLREMEWKKLPPVFTEEELAEARRAYDAKLAEQELRKAQEKAAQEVRELEEAEWARQEALEALERAKQQEELAREKAQQLERERAEKAEQERISKEVAEAERKRIEAEQQLEKARAEEARQKEEARIAEIERQKAEEERLRLEERERQRIEQQKAEELKAQTQRSEAERKLAEENERKALELEAIDQEALKAAELLEKYASRYPSKLFKEKAMELRSRILGIESEEDRERAIRYAKEITRELHGLLAEEQAMREYLDRLAQTEAQAQTDAERIVREEEIKEALEREAQERAAQEQAAQQKAEQERLAQQERAKQAQREKISDYAGLFSDARLDGFAQTEKAREGSMRLLAPETPEQMFTRYAQSLPLWSEAEKTTVIGEDGKSKEEWAETRTIESYQGESKCSGGSTCKITLPVIGYIAGYPVLDGTVHSGGTLAETSRDIKTGNWGGFVEHDTTASAVSAMNEFKAFPAKKSNVIITKEGYIIQMTNWLARSGSTRLSEYNSKYTQLEHEGREEATLTEEMNGASIALKMYVLQQAKAKSYEIVSHKEIQSASRNDGERTKKAFNDQVADFTRKINEKKLVLK